MESSIIKDCGVKVEKTSASKRLVCVYSRSIYWAPGNTIPNHGQWFQLCKLNTNILWAFGYGNVKDGGINNGREMKEHLGLRCPLGMRKSGQAVSRSGDNRPSAPGTMTGITENPPKKKKREGGMERYNNDPGN